MVRLKQNLSGEKKMGGRWADKIVAFLLCFHAIVLITNNLPHTAFTRKVDKYYLWYLNVTGQYQNGWGMYGTPARRNDRFQIKIYSDSDPLTDYKFKDITRPRELYFVEAMSLVEPVTQTNIARKHLQYKEGDIALEKGEKLELHKYSETIELNGEGVGLDAQIWVLSDD